MIKKIIVILNVFIVVSVTEQDNKPKDHPQALNNNNATFSTVYDQRQTGKYNINVNIKDLAIISVEPENLSANIGDTGSFYEDYYDYDLDDFTLSPIAALLGSVNDTRPSSRPTSEQTDITPNSSSQSTIILSELTTNAGPIKQTTSNQNVIVIDNEEKKDQTTILAPVDNKLNEQQQQQIPVQIIMDPIIKSPKIRTHTQSRYRSKQHQQQQQHGINGRNSPVGGGGNNLRPRNLNKFVASERKIDNECDNDEFRDRHGRCRSRRTALRKIVDLFTMMLPNE